jgi:hypothetical protein
MAIRVAEEGTEEHGYICTSDLINNFKTFLEKKDEKK